MQKTLVGAPKSEIKTRAYGVPTRAIATRFPKFRERIHVFEPENLPKEGTRYCFFDPASSRNWFILWVLVDPHRRHWVYREWPSEGIYIPGSATRARGPSRTGEKRTANRAVPRPVSAGGSANIWKRSKGWKARKESWNAGWTRFRQHAHGSGRRGHHVVRRVRGPGFEFRAESSGPDRGRDILINSMLDFDDTTGAEPTLFISSQCKALIFSLKVWTGRDEKKARVKTRLTVCGGLRSLGCMTWARR